MSALAACKLVLLLAVVCVICLPGYTEDERKSTGPPEPLLSEEIVTPHVKWAKPYAAGGLKTLIINSAQGGSETVELGQRVDMDYAAPAFTPFHVEQAVDAIREGLQTDLAVIVIGGFAANPFPAEITNAILEKIKAGTGLVWINPNECPDSLWEVLPVSGFAGGSTPEAKWHATADHYLTVGIPWEELPPQRTSQYNAVGEVLARADDYPLLITQPLGEGRIVCLGYCTSTTVPPGYWQPPTPWMRF